MANSMLTRAKTVLLLLTYVRRQTTGANAISTVKYFESLKNNLNESAANANNGHRHNLTRYSSSSKQVTVVLDLHTQTYINYGPYRR
jgi:hypothetical protein